jgi:hypothetical protein
MKSYKDFTKYEKSQQELILSFYQNQMGFTPNRTSACIDFDFEFEINGKKFFAEEKFREKDYGDFLIEIMQDAAKGNKGWYYTTSAYFLFYIVGNNKVYIINWHKFKEWFKENYKNIKLRTACSCQGYGLSINVSINWEDIPKQFYTKHIIKPVIHIKNILKIKQL